MTRKYFLALVAFLTLGASVYAQEINAGQASQDNEFERRVILNRWYQDWEIAARIGTQAYLGEYVLTDFKFKDWWTLPAVDVNVSKWGTQSIGLSLGFTWYRFKSLYSRTSENECKYATFAHPGSDAAYDGTGFNIARGHAGNAYISVMFDLCNLFGSYRNDRIYKLIANIGGGIMFPLSAGNNSYKDICSSFNAALINRFDITDNLSIDLSIRGTLHDDMFNGISYYNSDDRKNLSVDATIGATVGLAYRFALKKDKFNEKNKWLSVNEVVPQTSAYKAMADKAVEAVAAAAAAEAALAAAGSNVEVRDAAPKESEDAVVAVAAEKDVVVKYRQLVNFEIDKWFISNREKVSILLAADFIKAHPDAKFYVQGMADIQTSNPKHNQFLSEKRVEAVYDALVNDFGVNPDQLVKSAHGGVDYIFFEDEQCTRSVLIMSADN